MSATEELLPCPFCGGKAKLMEGLHRVDGDVYPLYGVCCLDADDSTYGVEHSIYGYFYEYEAVEAWNTRAQETCQMTEVFCGTASGVEWVCSACGSTCFVSEPMDTDEKPNYCLNCGRKVVE